MSSTSDSAVEMNCSMHVLASPQHFVRHAFAITVITFFQYEYNILGCDPYLEGSLINE